MECSNLVAVVEVTNEDRQVRNFRNDELTLINSLDNR